MVPMGILEVLCNNHIKRTEVNFVEAEPTVKLTRGQKRMPMREA